MRESENSRVTCRVLAWTADFTVVLFVVGFSNTDMKRECQFGWLGEKAREGRRDEEFRFDYLSLTLLLDIQVEVLIEALDKH